MSLPSLRVSKATVTGLDNWIKVMKSSMWVKYAVFASEAAYKVKISGHVCFNADRSRLLVDNLVKGFDLYNYPHTSPSDSFEIPRERAFIQEAIFLEDETTIACGSDHGYIYIFSVGTTKCLQKVKHASSNTLVQVLAVRALSCSASSSISH